MMRMTIIRVFQCLEDGGGDDDDDDEDDDHQVFSMP